MRRSKVSADPRCWWCGIQTEPETGYRGSAPELGLPPGSGVVVCTPACPERPAEATVWAAGENRRQRRPRPAKNRNRQETAAA